MTLSLHSLVALSLNQHHIASSTDLLLSMERLKDTWIASSGQMWKLCLFAVLAFVSLVLFVLLILSHRGENMLDRSEKAIIALGFVGIGSLWLLWLGFAFRCPRCNGNIGKFVSLSASASVWFKTLLTLDTCPYCNIRLIGSRQ